MKTTVKKISLKALAVGVALLFTACGQDKTTTTTEEMETDTEMTREGMPQEGMAQDTMGQGMMTGMMGHMHKNMQEMRGMRMNMTGDPDYDFAQIMIRHHQGGIRMAEEEVASGTDSQLKEIANRIITSNKADIQKLQDFQKTHKTVKADTAITMQMMMPMNKMMAEMHQRDMSGMSMDQHFAQMMIHHHQMGNEVARQFQKQAKTPQMKEMAQKIIDQQSKEIQELEAWQKQNQK